MPKFTLSGSVARSMAVAGLIFCTPSVSAQTVGSCSAASAMSVLDANNVSAPLRNDGRLFYGDADRRYYVAPRYSGKSSIFAGSFVVVGKQDDTLRGATGTYGPNDFWPGPIEDNGSSPGDCTIYDRIYTVSRQDIDLYETTQTPADDLRDWPTGLGAPTLDASGNLLDLMSTPLNQRRDRVINLAAGERPAIKGSQSLWWLMQDRGNVHERSELDPLGIEVHVMASAAPSTIEAIGNATIFEYRIFNKSARRIDSTYIGIWSDVDLGDAWDDHVGADTLRNLGYVYNRQESDRVYGERPPAVGFRILTGPAAENDGVDNNWNGLTDEAGEQLGMTNLMPIYKNTSFRANPSNGKQFFTMLQSRWHDGSYLREGNDGYFTEGKIVRYGFPADPVVGAYWSEDNSGDSPPSVYGTDRRILLSTGPFTMEPGEETQFAFATVWAQGANRLESITLLKEASDIVKDAFEAGYSDFPNGPYPDGPLALNSPHDASIEQPTDVTLRWDESPLAAEYQIEVRSGIVTDRKYSLQPRLLVEDLQDNSTYSWRVRPVNIYGEGAWSEERVFTTGSVKLDEARPILSAISTVSNALGILDPPDITSTAYEGPCPAGDGICSEPTPFYQQSSNGWTWRLEFGNYRKNIGPPNNPESRLGALTMGGTSIDAIRGQAFEMRITPDGGMAAVAGDLQTLVPVPFELWHTGNADLSVESDDYRLIPVLCELVCDAGRWDGQFDFHWDRSDRISWYEPQFVAPGASGYWNFINGDRKLGRSILSDMYLNRTSPPDGPYTEAYAPEIGTVFRVASSTGWAPILAAPENGAIVDPGSNGFYWEGSERDAYRLQVSLDASFTDLVLESDVTSSGFTVVDLAPGRYFWRVVGYIPMASEIRSIEIRGNDTTPGSGQSFTLYANYPNPFSGTTTLGVDITALSAPDVTSPATIDIAVYDMLGRRVFESVLEARGPGYQTFQFDGSTFASGIYILRASDGSSVQTQMLTIVR